MENRKQNNQEPRALFVADKTTFDVWPAILLVPEIPVEFNVQNSWYKHDFLVASNHDLTKDDFPHIHLFLSGCSS